MSGAVELELIFLTIAGHGSTAFFVIPDICQK